MSAMTVIKEVSNAKLLMSGTNKLIRIDKVRLSYPFIGTPTESTDDKGEVVLDRKTGKPKLQWRIVAMLAKATHTPAKNLVKEVIQELIEEAKKTDPKTKVPKDKWFLTDGDEKEDENMHDHFLISASDARIRPTVRDARGQRMDDIDKIDQTFYGGCYGHILIRPWYFNGKAKGSDKTYPKRIIAGLSAVSFYKDGDPFGNSRIDDEEAWGDVPTDGDGMGDADDDEGEI